MSYKNLNMTLEYFQLREETLRHKHYSKMSVIAHNSFCRLRQRVPCAVVADARRVPLRARTPLHNLP